METRLGLLLLFINCFECNGDEILDQLRQVSLIVVQLRESFHKEVEALRMENSKLRDDLTALEQKGNDRSDQPNNDELDDIAPFGTYRRIGNSVQNILGIPSTPEDLPPSEPVLPGNTLLRPSFGMLKSALKFPHREYEDGAGVDGNLDNLGLRYGATQDRLRYSSFRRMPGDYVMVEVPNQKEQAKPLYYVSSAVLDMENQKPVDAVLKHLEKLGRPIQKRNLNLYYYGDKKVVPTPTHSRYLDQANKADSSIYWNPGPEDVPVNESNKRHRSYKEIFSSLDDVIAKLLGLRQEMALASSQSRRSGLLAPILERNRDAGELSGIDASAAVEMAQQRKPLNVETEQVTPSLKKTWWRTKNLFSRVKVPSDAPDISEFLPKDAFENHAAEWWYFTQDDFTSLTKTED